LGQLENIKTIKILLWKVTIKIKDVLGCICH